MTNIDTPSQNASIVEKKPNIRYLTDVFPHKYGYARHLAARLNGNGKKSVMGYEYTANMVAQIVKNGYNDQNVEPELLKMAEEYTGSPVEICAPLYVKKGTHAPVEA